MTYTANLQPALAIQRQHHPSEWKHHVAALDEANTQYLREEYRRWRMSQRLARTTDPDTSHQAAERTVASGRRDDHVTRVVAAIRSHPGRTSAELAQITGLERHEAARRTADAEHAGRVRKGPARKCRVSGRAAITWHVPMTSEQQNRLWGDAA
jgi:hypothetical protein